MNSGVVPINFEVFVNVERHCESQDETAKDT